MNIFWITDVLVTLLLCQKIIAFSYTSKDGVNLSYNFRFKRSCRGEYERIGILPGIALPECVKECGMRPLCKALNYKRMFNTCHLYTSEENADDRSKGSCVEVKRSDIEIKEKPCDTCDQDKTCVPGEKTCKPTECPHKATLLNGQILGNMNSVGDRIQYKCDFGYEVGDDSEYAVCLDSGHWNVTVDQCTKINVQNVALDKPTNMSSLYRDNNIYYGKDKGVDGNTNQMMSERSCFHTNKENNPWWRVDLEAIYDILNVTVFNRLDPGPSERANNLSLAVGTSDQNMEQVGFVPGQIDDIHTCQFPTGKEARYVQVQLMGGDKVLHLCEVQVFGIPGEQVQCFHLDNNSRQIIIATGAFCIQV